MASRRKGAPVYQVTAREIYAFGVAVTLAAFAQTMLYVAVLTEVA